MQSLRQITPDIKSFDPDTIPDFKVPFGEPRRRNRNPVSGTYHPLGDLPHYLLNAASTRMIEFTTKQETHFFRIAS
jgi:hypothetical protein